MRHALFEALTWGTVSAAVASAFWLAAVDLDRAAEWRQPLAVPQPSLKASPPPTARAVPAPNAKSIAAPPPKS